MLYNIIVNEKLQNSKRSDIIWCEGRFYMTETRKLRIEEVAMLIGSSVQSINNWYRFKKNNPENELCMLLPEFEQTGERQTRYWNSDDIWKLIEFKNAIPHGRNGVMGSVTQKYCRKETTIESN